jgi:hypothetical protein
MLSEFVLAAAAVENATASVGEYDDGFAAYVVVAGRGRDEHQPYGDVRSQTT